MVQLLTNNDVVGLLSQEGDAVAHSLDIVERTFVLISRGETSSGLGHAAYPPSAQSFADAQRILFGPLGLIPDFDAMLVGVIPADPDYVVRTHSLFEFLYSYSQLQLLCIIENDDLHRLMVGAQFGLGAKWLAKADAEVLAVLGSGKMARACVRAISAVRDLTEVRVFSPTIENRNRFVEEIRSTQNLAVVASDSAEEAVVGADIVQCATNAEARGTEKVVEVEWLAPGTHVSTMSRNELGEDAAKVARVIPSTTSQVLAVHPEWKPWKEMIQQERLENRGPDLVDVIGKGEVGRTGDEEITIYLGANPGALRVAMASWIFDEAKRLRVGQEWVLS